MVGPPLPHLALPYTEDPKAQACGSSCMAVGPALPVGRDGDQVLQLQVPVGMDPQAQAAVQQTHCQQ